MEACGMYKPLLDGDQFHANILNMLVLSGLVHSILNSQNRYPV